MQPRACAYIIVLFVLALIFVSVSFAVQAVASDRMISISDFNDGGLSTGSHNIVIYLPKNYHRSDDRYSVVYFSDGDKLSRGSWDVESAEEGLEMMD